MKTALLILSLGFLGHGQTRMGQCGGSPVMAFNPGMTGPAGAAPQVDAQSMKLSTRGGFAAKPANSRLNVQPVLPQIQYRRPTGVPAVSCWCGTVGANALTSEGSSQEVPIITGLAGNFRFDHILIQETKQFSSDVVSSLAVAAGRPNVGEDLVPEFALKSQQAPQNYAYEVPEPPVLTGTYNLVLKFVGTSPLAIAGSSNFSSGAVNWEVCGRQVQ